MDDELNTLLIGVIIVILAVNTTAVFSLASTVYGGEYQQKVASGGNATSLSAATVKPTATPTATAKATAQKTPAPAKTTAVSTPPPEETPSIITIETPVIKEQGSHAVESALESNPAEADYVTIYSLSGYTLTPQMPDVTVDLKNPPLVLEYSVMPVNITDLKYLEYKMISTMHYENISVERPYENTYFSVTVTDKETGTIVLQDGYGKTYGLEPSRRLLVYRSGTYLFDFDGLYGSVTLTMKVPREGNLP